MKISMILAWCFCGAATLIGLVLLLIYTTYQVDGTQALGCALGDTASCQALQAAQLLHDVVGVLALFCLLAIIGTGIWGGVATYAYVNAERVRLEQWARWYQAQAAYRSPHDPTRQ